MYLIHTEPKTRVNDRFVYRGLVDCTPCAQDISHDLVQTPANTDSTRLRADFYRHVALDIVTETVFDYPYPAITSKTLRPMAAKRMMVVFGPAGTLRMLHTKGFETWGDFVDESYDSIADAEERLLAAAAAVRAFCQRDMAEIKQYMQHNAQRFEHNLNVLRALRSKELQEFCQRHGL